MPTIPDNAPPVSVRFMGLRIALPAVVAAALISAGTTVALARVTHPAESPRDDVAELRGDVKALAATVRALEQAQRDLLERINRDADARSNAALVDALKRGAP
jgi:hypothetical protein